MTPSHHKGPSDKASRVPLPESVAAEREVMAPRHGLCGGPTSVSRVLDEPGRDGQVRQDWSTPAR